MINFEAFYKISYGLYIVAAGDKSKGNAYISNTFFQVTSEPPQFATCCNKDNFTAGIIQKHGAFSVSVLHQDTTPDIYGKFGYKSGKDTDKMQGAQLTYGKTGTPIVLDGCIAYLECKVFNTIDLGTHLMFIGDLVTAEVVDGSLEPMTYAYYRQVKKGVAPKNAPTYIDQSKLKKKAAKSANKYRCLVCGYIYDDSEEDTPFEDLPDTWVCPSCGADKEDFELIK